MGAEGRAAKAHRAAMHSGRPDKSGTTRRTDEGGHDQNKNHATITTTYCDAVRKATAASGEAQRATDGAAAQQEGVHHANPTTPGTSGDRMGGVTVEGTTPPAASMGLSKVDYAAGAGTATRRGPGRQRETAADGGDLPGEDVQRAVPSLAEILKKLQVQGPPLACSGAAATKQASSQLSADSQEFVPNGPAWTSRRGGRGSPTGARQADATTGRAAAQVHAGDTAATMALTGAERQSVGEPAGNSRPTSRRASSSRARAEAGGHGARELWLGPEQPNNQSLSS